MKKYHFKKGDPVIVTTVGDRYGINKSRSKPGVIAEVTKHKTLSTMYCINDNDGEFIGRFYLHQLKLNKPAMRDYKLKQLGI